MHHYLSHDNAKEAALTETEVIGLRLYSGMFLLSTDSLDFMILHVCWCDSPHACMCLRTFIHVYLKKKIARPDVHGVQQSTSNT